MADDSSKTCFVICPIGAPGSAERQRTETLIEYVVSPALEPLGYARPVRPTNSISQGSSRTRFVQHIEADDLVVADLTDANANVFYEVAARHVIEKPIVHLVIGDQLDEIPFDVNQVRAIPYQLDVQSANEALAKIRAQVEAIERTGEVGTNPLSQGFEVAAQKRSAVPVEQALGELRISFDELRAEVRAARSDPSLLAALGSSYGAGRYGAGTYGGTPTAFDLLLRSRAQPDLDALEAELAALLAVLRRRKRDVAADAVDPAPKSKPEPEPDTPANP